MKKFAYFKSAKLSQTIVVCIWQSFICLCPKCLEIDHPPHLLREKFRAHALIHLRVVKVPEVLEKAKKGYHFKAKLLPK